MVIEWLKIEVPPEIREKYIQKDAEIWTAFLATCPGFLGKEVWLNPNDPTGLTLVIRWETRENWKSISSERLQQVEEQFDQAMGDSYPIIDSAEYQVRKFPQV
ncbi:MULTISPECIES: TIGR03792 family protein [Cyanophyceae]|uniref:TIGR03792 family protein n=1 Tax=Cyanophyceae TaxID=3028117 RepID=UPI001682CEBF|nr:TIGR03792 family protein [Trichocoleus sp. FACHB-69]MBD1831105.1 TIGR03792 family protein [Cyanobacteria bacterium FACHB-472]MBD1934707.1 TIGR03792 family protein [Trichocoleus sp. FACHB-69]